MSTDSVEQKSAISLFCNTEKYNNIMAKLQSMLPGLNQNPDNVKLDADEIITVLVCMETIRNVILNPKVKKDDPKVIG